MAILRELIEQGLETGELQSDDTLEEIIDFFLIVYRGVVFDWCVYDGEYDLGDKLHKAMKRLLKIYKREP